MSTGGIFSGEDDDVLDSFRWGLACGAASCLFMENSRLDLADVRALYDAFRVTEVSWA